MSPVSERHRDRAVGYAAATLPPSPQYGTHSRIGFACGLAVRPWVEVGGKPALAEVAAGRRPIFDATGDLAYADLPDARRSRAGGRRVAEEGGAPQILDRPRGARPGGVLCEDGADGNLDPLSKR